MHPGKNHKLFTSELQFESGQIRLTKAFAFQKPKKEKRKREDFLG